MSATFTSRLQNFSAPYISELLNAGASLALGNAGLALNTIMHNTAMHKTVANAELKVLNKFFAQTTQVEKRLAAPKNQHALKAQPRLLSVQNIEEKNASQLAFKMPIDAHKHRRKPPALHSYSALYHNVTT